jgi:curved DNA-binding protein CbpA
MYSINYEIKNQEMDLGNLIYFYVSCLFVSRMGNQNGKQHTYQHYYDALKNGGTGVGALPPVNPYEVLGVSKQFTWEELKTNYRRMASLVHPDKGGSDQLFQTVTECFRTLAKDYQQRAEGASHIEMKQASQRHYDERGTAPSPSLPIRQTYEGESFQERFNRLFDEHKIEEDDHRGYGHLMEKSSKKREDISIPTTMKKFNKDAFHQAFNQLPTREQNQVVKFKEPEALVLTKNISFTELGSKTDDFTHQDPTAKTGLFYTDYMEAYNEHNQRLIDPEKYKRKEFKSVDQYDAYRTKKSAKPISEREQSYLNQQKQHQEQREAERQQRLVAQDEMYRAQHEKLQRLMLRN